MSWLTPLGLLGLIGLIILIIIYIIKPNFQNKVISSTFIWKLSLKYRKKKIPISKLRNILLFICQVLIITIASIILAQPFLKSDESDSAETVIIIDASASMLSENGGFTRFERAVNQANAYADAMLAEEKHVSVIVAAEESYFLLQQVGIESALAVKTAFDSLLDVSDDPVYTLGEPDIDGAIKLAEEITAYNADCEVILYTDTTYIDKGQVRVVDVSEDTDWNAAILDVRAIFNEGKYTFEIDVACYGKDADVDVYCSIYGVNIEESTYHFTTRARCSADEKVTLVISADEEVADEVLEAANFNYVHAYVNERDSLSNDNSFYLYGGKKPEFKIQYASAMPNSFFTTTLLVLREQLGDYWDIDIDEIRNGEVPKTEGYDLYIFEHEMPSTIPTDGIVILANPDKLPTSSGIQLGKTYTASGSDGEGVPLSAGDAHPLLNTINPERIKITKFTEIANSDGYTPIMYCEDYPVVMVKDEPEEKIVVMTFNLNFSTFAVTPDFPIFMLNVLNHFAPQTIDKFVFDVNETIEFNGRSDAVNVSGPDVNATITPLPGEIKVTESGVYTVTQDIISGDTVIESFYVKIPETESNINLEVDVLPNPFFYLENDVSAIDLLLYFAIALVALLFIEWWLKSREQL